MGFSRMAFCLSMFFSGLILASPPSESTPWTKSFLETRVAAAVDYSSFSPRGERFEHMSTHQTEGSLYVSSSPKEDWELDVGIQGRSLPTRKIFARAERQLLSDLDNDPLALTAVALASTSGSERSHNPVFFEMARTVGEAGIGLGRHLVIQKRAYTQLFAYLVGGVGSSNARYARAEIGLQEVLSLRHYLRVCLSHTRTFGHTHKAFRGIGTLKTDVNTVEASYAYRFDNGIEARCTYALRMLTKGGIRRSTALLVSLSLPISL